MKSATAITTLALALATVFLVGCVSAPPDPRIGVLQQRLESLMANTELAARGGDDLKRAEAAVRRVATPKLKQEEFEESVYSADRLIDVAEYAARARLADDRRQLMVLERERLVLEARTREARAARTAADQARAEAATALALKESALLEVQAAELAKADAEAARLAATDQQRLAEQAAQLALSEAEQARLVAQVEASKAEEARLAAESERARAEALKIEAQAARAEMDSLRFRLAELEARPTERGLLLTLGDVLFALNEANLKSGAARTLVPLVDVLLEKTDQSVVVEGHTDSTGGRDYNLELSQRRAEAVRSFLVDQGVDPDRIRIEGLGPDFPVADNLTAEGRQLNRRVEVILPNTQSR